MYFYIYILFEPIHLNVNLNTTNKFFLFLYFTSFKYSVYNQRSK
jgi:hypothetical protein